MNQDVRAVASTAVVVTRSLMRIANAVRLGVAALAAGSLLVLTLAPGPVFASEEAKAIIIKKGCIACHTIPGVPGAAGTYGPSLKGIGNRARLAGGIMANTDENLRDWLKNPKDIKPDTLMPNLGLSDQEIDILIKYLNTLL